MNSLYRFHWTRKGFPAIIHASNIEKECDMSHNIFLKIEATHHHEALRGFWKIAPGRALSLQPQQAGLLRVAQGRVWATLGTRHPGAGNELGDYFLHAGEQLAVSPGQHLVLEQMVGSGQQAAFFEWTAVPHAADAGPYVRTSVLAQPLRELVLALGMVGTALARLCAGLLVSGRQLIWSRPAVVVHTAAHCS
jgi:hypothetical protein